MAGLIRGVARTAVVAGTATAVSNRVSRRQAARWNEREQERYAAPTPTPPAADPMADRLTRLRQLGELRAQGVLTDAEFERQKSLLLNGPAC